MVVAAIGILVNGITAWLFASGAKDDINIRGAFLHMAADAAVSAGVVVAGLVIWMTGLAWIDPAVSLVVAGLVVWATWGLLRDSVAMSLNAVPPQISPAAVEGFLRERPGVADLHDLHIWSMSTTSVALTAHLVMAQGHPGNGFLVETCEGLRAKLRHRACHAPDRGSGRARLPPRGSLRGMIRAFVTGHPIAHSRSPLIHGHWLAEHGIAGSYERIDVPPADFPAFLRGLPGSGFAGATSPSRTRRPPSRWPTR